MWVVTWGLDPGFRPNCRFIQKIWKFTVSCIIHKASGLSCEHLSSFSCLIPVTFTVFHILMKPYDEASVLSTWLAFLLRDYIGFSYCLWLVQAGPIQILPFVFLKSRTSCVGISKLWALTDSNKPVFIHVQLQSVILLLAEHVFVCCTIWKPLVKQQGCNPASPLRLSIL